jgi:hypothetical protein
VLEQHLSRNCQCPPLARRAQPAATAHGKANRVATPKFFGYHLQRAKSVRSARSTPNPAIDKTGDYENVISAAEVYTELNEYLAAGVARSGLDLLQFFPTPEDARRFSDGMPSTRDSRTVSVGSLLWRWS